MRLIAPHTMRFLCQTIGWSAICCEWMVFEMLLMTVTITKSVVLQKRNAVSFQNTFTAVHNSTVANQLFALSNDNNNNDNAIAFF